MKKQVEVNFKGKKVKILFKRNWFSQGSSPSVSVILQVYKKEHHKGFQECQEKLEERKSGELYIKTGEIDTYDFFDKEYGDLVRSEWLKIKWMFEKMDASIKEGKECVKFN